MFRHDVGIVPYGVTSLTGGFFAPVRMTISHSSFLISINFRTDLFDLVSQALKVLKRLFHLVRIAQDRRGMEHRHHPDPFGVDPDPVLSGDPKIRLDQPHSGDPAECDDDLRTDHLGLRPEIADTGVLLVLLRVAVVRRTALDDIGDVDILVTVEIDGVEHFIKQLSGFSDKGFSLEILLLSRTLRTVGTDDSPSSLS